MKTFHGWQMRQYDWQQRLMDEDLRAAFRKHLNAAFAGRKKYLVAREAGIDPTTISRWLSESEPREPGIFSVKRIADELGTTVGSLLEETPLGLTTADLEILRRFVAWANSKLEGSISGSPVTTSQDGTEGAEAPSDVPSFLESPEADGEDIKRDGGGGVRAAPTHNDRTRSKARDTKKK